MISVEHEILNFLITNDYVWLARDERGHLWAYQGKPLKHAGHWVSDDLMLRLDDITAGLFKYVLWEDKEPTDVWELSKEYEDDESD